MAVHLIVHHATQHDGDIMRRHGEGDRIAIGGIAQPLRIRGEAQVVITRQQVCGEGDLIAGSDGVHIRQIVGQDRPGIETFRIGNGELSGNVGQRQGNLVLRLASGKGQSAINGFVAALAQHDCALGAIEGRAGDGQRPAILLALHRHEGQRCNRAIVGSDGELGICGRVGRIDDVGDLSGDAVDGHFHIDGRADVAVQIVRGKDGLEGEFAHFIQEGGGLLPCYFASHNGSVRGGRLQIERDAAQEIAVISGILHFAGENRGRAGDGNACAGLLADDGIQVRVGNAKELAGLEVRQGNGGIAGGHLRLLKYSASDAEGSTVDHFAGRNVGRKEVALRDIQHTSRVLDGFGHINFNLHADLGIDGDQHFSGAIAGRIVGREHDLVDLAAVIRAQGNDGVIRPREAALHGCAFEGCRAGQSHILEAGAVGNVTAANGIDDVRGDGHRVLLNLQRDILASDDGRAVVAGEGDGDLHSVGIACAIFHCLAGLLSRYGEHIEISRARCIRGYCVHSKGLDILNAGEIVHAHRVRVRNGVQRRLDNIIDGNFGSPVGLVGAVAGGAGRNHNVQGRLRQTRAGPAKECMAVRNGVAQHDVRALDGIFFRRGLNQLAATKFAADGVDGGFPGGSQGYSAGGASGDAGNAIGDLGARRRPAKERISLAGGFAKDNLAALNVVEVGIGRVVLAAVQLVGDDEVHRLPSRVQRHAALGKIRIDVDIAIHADFLRAEPAEELVVLALRRFGDICQRHTHVFHGHMVGCILLAIVQLIGQNGDPLPAGIEGHAPGKHVFRGIHRLAREVRGEIPAEEIIAVIVGQNVFQSGFAQLVRGVGVTGIFTLVAGEDQAVVVGCRLSLRAAEIHGNVHTPVGIQGDIVGNLLREVERFALAGGVVVPARKGQAFDGRIGRLHDGTALQHICAVIGAQLYIVVHEVRLVAAHAAEGNFDIVERHGEGDGVVVHGVLQARRLRGQAQALVALLQFGREGDRVASHDGVHLGRIMRLNTPAIDAFFAGDRELMSKLAQRQNDHGFRLASGDGQTTFNVFAAVYAQQDRALDAVEVGAIRGQGPAVRLAIHGREGHRFRRVASANREYGVFRRFGGIDDVSDFTGKAGEALCEQPEGQVVFLGGFKGIEAHGSASGRQIAQGADARNAVLHAAVNLVASWVEPGQGRDVDIGILLLHRCDHGVEVDFAGAAGLYGAAQNMGVLQAGGEYSSVVPFGGFDAPGVRTPVVQRDIHVDGGGGHLELTREGEHLPVVLDQLRFVLVFIGQYHIARVVCNLVGSGCHFIRVDCAELVIIVSIADDDDIDARIIRRDRLTVDDDILKRQLGGDVALLQVFKQQLVVGADSGEHVVGLHG